MLGVGFVNEVTSVPFDCVHGEFFIHHSEFCIYAYDILSSL